MLSEALGKDGGEISISNHFACARHCVMSFVDTGTSHPLSDLQFRQASPQPNGHEPFLSDRQPTARHPV